MGVLGEGRRVLKTAIYTISIDIRDPAFLHIPSRSERGCEGYPYSLTSKSGDGFILSAQQSTTNSLPRAEIGALLQVSSGMFH